MSNSDQAEYWAAQKSWATHQAQMDALLQPVLDLVLSETDLKPAEKVLDIGCGTGASTHAAAQAVGPSGHALGVDISPTLLEVARTRLTEIPQAQIREADAQTAPLGHGFDAMISRFGVMFFSDTPAAFRNIARALIPGGRLIMAAWAPPAVNPWFMRPAEVARTILGEMPPTDRTEPGPFAFDTPERILPMLRAAGLQDAICTRHDLSLPSGSPKAAADLCMAIGPAVRALRYFEADETQRTAVRSGLRTMFEEFATPDGLRIPAAINLYTARTPA